MDFLFFLLPPAEDSPEGLWQRTGDRFAGCVLRVEKTGAELVGRAGWVEGDLKWRNLVRNARGDWRMQDLRKHYDTRTATVTMVDYLEYRLTVGLCGHLRLHADRLPFFPVQRWVKFQGGA
jgi:hypothetical protein